MSGVILFRGTGADALRYVEAERSRADDYFLSESTGVWYSVLDGSGEAARTRVLTVDECAGWVAARFAKQRLAQHAETQQRTDAIPQAEEAVMHSAGKDRSRQGLAPIRRGETVESASRGSPDSALVLARVASCRQR